LLILRFWSNVPDGFVRPETGRTFWLLLPTVNKKWLFSMTIDRAGWHISKDVDLPEGLHLLPLPAHSPELQFPISTILGN